MKRFIHIVLAALLTFASVAAPTDAFATTEAIDAISTPNMVLMEASTRTVLYDRNMNERVYPASTTKVMTCLVALENCDDLSEVYTCGYEATAGFGMQSSLLHLQPGDEVTIRDMLYGLMLVSGNDCGACLAVATAGSNDAFVQMMNAKAQEIGMTNTHFTNAHGLQDEDHYTTAYDMALLLQYALNESPKKGDFRTIFGKKEYDLQIQSPYISDVIYTSNKLLYTKDNDTENNEYAFCIGGKTGETNYAGYCLVSAAEQNGTQLIAVQFGDNNQGGTSTYYRFRSARQLYEWGFSEFVRHDFSSIAGLPTEFNIQTTGYPADDPDGGVITASADISGAALCGLRSELGTVDASAILVGEPELDTEAVAVPVEIGDLLGYVSYYYKGTLIHKAPLIATEAMLGPGAVPPVEDPSTITQAPFVSNSPDQSKRNDCNLTISKNGGKEEYTVWAYYGNNLFTIEDATTYHYLYCDGDVFRASTSPGGNMKLTLYQQMTDEAGNVYFAVTDAPVDGGIYLIMTDDGMALQCKKSSRSIAAARIAFDESGNIITAITGDLLWTFAKNGIGYNLVSNGRYLHRSAGDSLLFWIIIAILVIVIIIVIRLLLTRKTRRRNPKRRGKYKIYRV